MNYESSKDKKIGAKCTSCNTNTLREDYVHQETMDGDYGKNFYPKMIFSKLSHIPDAKFVILFIQVQILTRC